MSQRPLIEGDSAPGDPPVSGRAIDETMPFDAAVVMGTEILHKATRGLLPYVAITTDPPWRLVGTRMGEPPADVRFVAGTELDIATLESLRRSLPDTTRCVVGVGSGIAMDAAKYVAWQCGLPLELIPTVTATDAPFSTTIVTREGGVYRSISCPINPRRILIDLAVVRLAPPRLNRAGVGDKLCAHTALHDWRLATMRGIDRPFDATAEFAEELVRTLEQRAEDFAAPTGDGLRLLMELHAREGALLRAFGHGRFVSGSEHLLVQVLESHGRSRFLHGEGVCLATITMAWVQRNEPERIARIARRTGIRFRPDELGVSSDALKTALRALPDYARRMGRSYTVANELDPAALDAEDWGELWSLLS